MTTKPLTGIRVLDLTRVLAGPYCAMLLGDMGAEIIKIEEPVNGDDSRGYPPFDKGVSTYFANLNRNKKSIGLNLKDPKAKEVLFELVKIADVIVENYKPGTMAKLGFSYETLKKVNPRIILGSISGFGQYGPYRERPGYDIIAQAMSGIMSITGWPDSPPTKTGTAIGDVLGGLDCCIGILAALQGRNQTGKGSWVDVSLVDAAVSAMETIFEIYLTEKRIPQRVGNRYEFIYPYDSFPAKDGWVVIAIGNDTLWKRFCETIGRPELFAEERFLHNKDRVSEHEAMYAAVSSWSGQHNMDEIIELLIANSIPCAPINTIDKIVNDPQIAKARKMIQEIDHPIKGKMRVIGTPIKFGGDGDEGYSKAPLLGEHTAEIMSGLLKMSDAEIAYFTKKKQSVL
jgi:crotonobetainyl-CoA:carnitine CoA-transferase CaiB-like acyl-CoA transferase